MRQQRLNAVLELVIERGNVSISDIIETLGVSAATARRDIGELADQRLVTRTHGGAAALGSAYELPLRYKVTRNAKAKAAIAATASDLISAGTTVALNGGTTTTEVARTLGRRPDLDRDGSLTVVTNALNIAYELSIRPNITIVVTGGTARSQSYELVGPLSEGVLGRINIDVAVLGADGITVDGLTTVHPAEAKVSADLIAAAGRVIVVADATKVEHSTFAKITPLERVDILVTDKPVEGVVGDALAEAGVEVLVAEGQD